MATNHECSNAPNEDTEFDKTPLWKYVTRANKVGEGGGNIAWKCNYCKKSFTSTYTRVKYHLLLIKGRGIGVCAKVSEDAKKMMDKEDKEAQEKEMERAPKFVPLPPKSSSGSIVVAKKRKGVSGGTISDSGSMSCHGTNPISKSFNLGERAMLDKLIARALYSAGLPFNLARNPYWKESYAYACKYNLAGYVPPGFNALRTTLLQQEKANIQRLLEPIQEKWVEKGVSIVSDGWSDSQRRPLINFMTVMDGQPVFLKAIDCSGETKDKYFIAKLLREVILEIGYEKVVQVITDNAANCKGAGQLIESEFPSIVWTPCVVHTLNLALKNICAAKHVENNMITYDQCNWITNIGDDVQFIKNFIMNHSMRLAMFNEFVSLKLLSVAETRFASMIVMLKRFKLINGGLQAMVISDKWSLYREDDAGRARTVKEMLLNDEWWDSIDYILSFTAPIYDMIRMCDTDKPCLHLVYDMWDCMIEKVKRAIYAHERKSLEVEYTFYNVVHKIMVDRWNKNNTPLHCLSHSLNPRYYTKQWLNEDLNRVAPHNDKEVSLERDKCLKKYYPNLMDRNKVFLEFASFIDKSGDFNDFDSIQNRYLLDPKSWWLIHGSPAPLLQSIALKLLVQPSSSSCAERNWSTYSFIHSLKRNKLTTQRAEDLVYIHSNLRLLSRKSEKYAEGDSKLWDFSGDAFDSLEDVGVLEVANLSLDEPELEIGVVNEDGGDNEGEMEVGSNEE